MPWGMAATARIVIDTRCRSIGLITSRSQRAMNGPPSSEAKGSTAKYAPLNDVPSPYKALSGMNIMGVALSGISMLPPSENARQHTFCCASPLKNIPCIPMYRSLPRMPNNATE